MNPTNPDSEKRDPCGIIHFLFCFIKSCEHLRDMAPPNIRIARMNKEVMDLTRNPPHGITCWTKNDRNDQLEASKAIYRGIQAVKVTHVLFHCFKLVVQGSPDTPYENGSFRIDITIPERYSFENCV